MAENSLNPLNEIRTRSFNLKCEGTQDLIVIGVFSGKISVSIAPNGKMQKGLSRRLSEEMVQVVRTTLKKVRDGEPETKYPIVVTKYDTGARKMVNDYVITLGKDAKRRYYVECNFGNGTFRGYFGKVNNITVGTDPFNEAEQSAIRYDAFVQWFTNVAALECLLTARKFVPGEAGKSGNFSRPTASSASVDEVSVDIEDVE